MSSERIYHHFTEASAIVEREWWVEFLQTVLAEAQGGSVRCQRCGGSGYTQSDDPARPLSRCGTCQGDGRYQLSQAQGGEGSMGESQLYKDLRALLNSHSAENASNTPDFILAEFLLGCLANWNYGVVQRERFYSRTQERIAP